VSNLSQRSARQRLVHPSWRAYVLAYVLWFLTFLLGLIIAFFVRDLSQMAMLFTPWDRYLVHLVNQASVVVLVVLLVMLVVFTEAYYRNGALQRELCTRFARVLGVLALILATAQILRFALEAAVGAVNLNTILILAIALWMYGGMRVMMRRHPYSNGAQAASSQRIYSGLFIAATLTAGLTLIVLPIKHPVNPYDEGLALVNGMRIAEGAIPFRDYWTIYPPGQSYVLAVLFHVFEQNVLVARVYDTVVRIALALVIYLIAAELLHSWQWALVPFMAAATLLAAATFYGYAVFPALLFDFSALALIFQYIRVKRRHWLIGAGALIGTAAFFRLDLGFYAAASAGALLLLFGFFSSVDESGWNRRVQRTLLDMLTVAAPAILILGSIYGFLASKAGLALLVDHLLIFPATAFRAVRWLPYPPLLPDWSIWVRNGSIDPGLYRFLGDYLRFYLPLLTFVLSGICLLWFSLRGPHGKSRLSSRDFMAAALIVLGVGLFAQALSRYDEIHVLPSSLCVVLLIGWLARTLLSVPRRNFAVVPVALLLIIAVPLYFLSPYTRLAEIVRYFPPHRCYSDNPRAGCVMTLPGQDEVVQILDREDPQRGPIFSGLLRHDNVFVNDVSIYFLAGRNSATRYHELHPGVTTTRAVQQEMVTELDANRPAWLVLVTWENPNEPNASRFSSGVRLLDEYIRDHYRREFKVGMYEMWRRQS
jgi:hypothetical protein